MARTPDEVQSIIREKQQRQWERRAKKYADKKKKITNTMVNFLTRTKERDRLPQEILDLQIEATHVLVYGEKPFPEALQGDHLRTVQRAFAHFVAQFQFTSLPGMDEPWYYNESLNEQRRAEGRLNRK